MTPTVSASTPPARRAPEHRPAGEQAQSLAGSTGSSGIPSTVTGFDETMKHLSSEEQTGQGIVHTSEQETLEFLMQQLGQQEQSEEIIALESLDAVPSLLQLVPGTSTLPASSSLKADIAEDLEAGSLLPPSLGNVAMNNLGHAQNSPLLRVLNSHGSLVDATDPGLKIPDELSNAEEIRPRDTASQTLISQLSSQSNKPLMNVNLSAVKETTSALSTSSGDITALPSGTLLPTASANATQESAPVRLPPGNPAQWRQSLMDALGDRIQVSVGNRGEQAVLRLDPPMMGSIEIMIRHEAGALQIQMNATHSEVQKQLQAISDNLKQELTQRHFTGVSVQVADTAMDNEGRQRQRYQAQVVEEPRRAIEESDQFPASSFALLTEKD